MRAQYDLHMDLIRNLPLSASCLERRSTCFWRYVAVMITKTAESWKWAVTALAAQPGSFTHIFGIKQQQQLDLVSLHM